MIINIRGTNGSGKTTLARSFLDLNNPVDLVWYDSPTSKDPNREKSVTGYVKHIPGMGNVCVVGSYAQAQGGLDTVPNFEIQQRAVKNAATDYDHVICEGILASTVAGSWLDFFKEMKEAGHDVAIGYLDTPVELCLIRIRERQERAGKVREIKEDQVRDKVKSIEATRAKFAAAGITTYTLFHEEAEVLLHRILTGDA